MNPFDLTGKTALVTGASRGIGLAMADSLATAGADIIAVSATLDLHGSAVQKAVESHGRSFTGYRVDFADPDAVTSFGAELIQSGSPIDILINNAGTIERAPAAQHSADSFSRVVQINLTSQFLLTQLIGRAMLARGNGRIIFTASLLSFQGGINVPGYTASKSAIAGLIRALANEWTASGVTVNGIAPGYIATDNTADLRADLGRRQAILDRIPAARWGEPEDLGGAAVFLSSDAARYISGAILPVDGGWLGR
ncbi:SDR family oxidoreductase [Arthrobacter sp. 24S4-2]|uniref:SDR family oxidoreductase n=1 Tax=Arthrobacter sp. 24S4-2 TaxID=2575374 RepID=UPI0010C7C3A6|nr:SDR family oxidoreductase [Arthrobacter sp. 24S4-2]QCP00062.1 SDR family oxidoreductase [Arthrobacter sp. 24S4-2]